MIIVKPTVMTDSNMTSSIPEPDGARGEVEWIDPDGRPLQLLAPQIKDLTTLQCWRVMVTYIALG